MRERGWRERVVLGGKRAGSVVAVAMAAGVAGRAWWRFMRRYGELLLRIEHLEGERDALARDARAARSAARTVTFPEPAWYLSGLPPAAAAPDFDLPDLDGHRVRLSAWRGRSVLLVFIDPICGYSRKIAPLLALLPPKGAGNGPVALVISRRDDGETEALLHAHGVRCPVLVQEDREVAVRYGVNVAPAAYLLDEAHQTTAPLTIGPVEVERLIRHVTAPALPGTPQPVQTPDETRLFTRLAPSRPMRRRGLPEGTPAPRFRLPRLGGGEVSHEDARGGQTLLVFLDASCPPCDRILPDLQRIHSAAAGPRVLAIGRGSVEALAHMRATLSLTFPIALQRHWEISQMYGMIAAPAAYLVDTDGILRSSVAVGGEAVIDLASESTGSSEA